MLAAVERVCEACFKVFKTDPTHTIIEHCNVCAHKIIQECEEEIADLKEINAELRIDLARAKRKAG